MNVWSRIFSLVLILLMTTFAWGNTPANKKHREMLYTVVTVESLGNLGSGTVVYSKKDKGDFETFILTNFHVVSSSVTISKEWSPIEKKKVDVEKRVVVKILWFNYNELSRFIGTRGKTADIVAYDKSKDIALLKVRDKERGTAFVARLRPPCRSIYLFDEVYAVGSGLGKPPFATIGTLSLMDEEIDGNRYMLATAPIIYGNSGGALFRLDNSASKYELIGIPSRVSATFFQSVTHMGFSIPMQTVWEFLKKNNYSQILPNGCEEKKGKGKPL